jgi:anaerobic C4-dicarboxylate transporter
VLARQIPQVLAAADAREVGPAAVLRYVSNTPFLPGNMHVLAVWVLGYLFAAAAS